MCKIVLVSRKCGAQDRWNESGHRVPDGGGKFVQNDNQNRPKTVAERAKISNTYGRLWIRAIFVILKEIYKTRSQKSVK